MRKNKETTLVALGANLWSTVGPPEITLATAIKHLEKNGAMIRNISSKYSTAAFPAGNGPDYVNAALEMTCPWDAEATLQIFHQIEAEFGREREQRWGQRCLDIDLIAMGDQVLPDAQTHENWRNLPLETQMKAAPEELILPHPRLQERAFVLVPLAEIAPDWVHPILGLSIRQMCDALPTQDLAGVRRMENGL